MSEPIEPALTAEEWAKRQNWVATIGAGDSLIVGPDDCPHWVESVDRHGVAALALYGQIFGFTREDVRELREDVLANVVSDGGTPEFIAWLESLIARISALLPPE